MGPGGRGHQEQIEKRGSQVPRTRSQLCQKHNPPLPHRPPTIGILPLGPVQKEEGLAQESPDQPDRARTVDSQDS